MVISNLNKSCFLSGSVISIREEKLSEPSKHQRLPAAGGDESRIFRTASDSSDFDSESMTVFSDFFSNTQYSIPEYLF